MQHQSVKMFSIFSDSPARLAFEGLCELLSPKSEPMYFFKVSAFFQIEQM